MALRTRLRGGVDIGGGVRAQCSGIDGVEGGGGTGDQNMLGLSRMYCRRVLKHALGPDEDDSEEEGETETVEMENRQRQKNRGGRHGQSRKRFALQKNRSKRKAVASTSPSSDDEREARVEAEAASWLYEEGEKVEARWKGGARYYAATIKRINRSETETEAQDGTLDGALRSFDLHYDDGGRERSVAPEFLRRIEQPEHEREARNNNSNSNSMRGKGLSDTELEKYGYGGRGAAFEEMVLEARDAEYLKKFR